jgi:hypothetical protein
MALQKLPLLFLGEGWGEVKLSALDKEGVRSGWIPETIKL